MTKLTVAFRNFVNVPKNPPTSIVTSCLCLDRCLLFPCSGYRRIYTAWVYLIIDKKNRGENPVFSAKTQTDDTRMFWRSDSGTDAYRSACAGK